MSNSTISDFQDETHPEQNSDPQTQLNEDDPTIDDIDLPDRGFGWEDEITQILDETLHVVKPEDSISLCGETLIEGAVGVVVGGLEEYLEEYGDRELEVPTSLGVSDEEIDPYVAEASTKGSSTVTTGERWGRGIPPKRLRKAISLATGRGQYRASEVTVTACGEVGFIVEYRGNAFAVAPTWINSLTETVATEKIEGVTIRNEENSAVLAGAKVVLRAINDNFNLNITGFRKRTADKLVFETDHPNGKPIWFTGNHLSQAATPTQDIEQLAGEHEYEAWHTDEVVEYEFDTDELPHKPGTFATEKEHKLVLGYTKKERRVTRGLRDEYGVGVKVHACPYYLKVRPDAYDNRIDTRICRSKCKPRMARIPFSEPDHPNPDELDSPETGFRN
jgi:hypothetical protein